MQPYGRRHENDRLTRKVQRLEQTIFDLEHQIAVLRSKLHIARENVGARHVSPDVRALTIERYNLLVENNTYRTFLTNEALRRLMHR